jgi:hypothetical protein
MNDKKTDETPPQVVQSGEALKRRRNSGDAMDGNVVDGNVVDKGAVSLHFYFICLHPALSLSHP